MRGSLSRAELHVMLTQDLPYPLQSVFPAVHKDD